MLGIAWHNVSLCVDMCEARAQHHCQYEVAESLLRFNIFNCVLQRAMHWMHETTHEDTVRIHCRVHTWTDGYWKRYAQEVRGYHSGHFAAALQDALQLASALRNLEEFSFETSSSGCRWFCCSCQSRSRACSLVTLLKTSLTLMVRKRKGQSLRRGDRP